MARGAVSAAKMMISDVPRLSVLVAVEEVRKMVCAVEKKGEQTFVGAFSKLVVVRGFCCLC